MTPKQMKRLDRRLSEFVDYVTDGMGRPERRRGLAWYLTGLLLDGGRKTTVSMASRLVDEEGEIEAMRQRLQQCVTISSWADTEIRRRVADRLEAQLRPEVFIVDDTGFPKKGRYSVGVARQYSGTLGAFARVHLAERHSKGRPPSAELWLIAEHRPGNNEYKFYVSDLPEATAKRELVRLVKLRWRVERDYQEMKGHVGLDHFEGRTWRGFHHHTTLCAVAHAFLAAERRLFPPEEIPLDHSNGPQTDSSPSAQTHWRLPALPPTV